jgi:uroporphyrinogen-III synthase
MDTLDGLRILVPESRQLDVFAKMIEDAGGRVIRCPLVQILDLEDSRQAETWIDQLIAGVFQDVIWLTGEGLRRLLAIAKRTDRENGFVSALGKVRSITRGPKPARALHEIGLAPGLAAAVPTSEGVIAALAAEDIRGRPIGVQLYPGDGAAHLLDHLKTRGAVVISITPYRYASQTETAQVISAVNDMIEGRVDAIAFTSTPQVERLFAVARDAGLESQLKDALQRIGVASIGPVVEEALTQVGVKNFVQPETAFHMKPLLRTIAAWKAERGVTPR